MATKRQHPRSLKRQLTLLVCAATNALSATNYPTHDPTHLPTLANGARVPSAAPTASVPPSNTYKPSAQPTPLPTAQPTPIPSPAPTAVPTITVTCSSKLCSELSWSPRPWGSDTVCGASDEHPLPGCSGQV
jgi:hypothetical protein